MTSSPATTLKPLEKLLVAILGVAAFYSAARILSELYSVVSSVTIPFDTDEADHANAAWELYRSFIGAVPIEAYKAFVRQAFYPPIHSIIVAISYFFDGPSYFSSRFPSLILYALSMITLPAVTFAYCHKGDRSFSFSFCAALVSLLGILACPIVAENSALCMLELMGVFLSILFFAFILFNRFKAATLILAILTFTKYSFGIFLGVGWFLFLLLRAVQQRQLKEFYLSLCLFIIPIIFWGIFSDIGSMWWFIIGHPSYDPILSSDNLLFELRAWFNDYSTSAIQGAFYLLGFLVGTYTFRRQIEFQAMFLIAVTAIGLLLLSTTNEARHFIVVAPIVWITASVAFISLLGQLNHTYLLRIGLLAILTLVTFGLTQLPSQLRAQVVKEMEGKPGYDKLANFVISHVEPQKSLLFVGTFDQFGIEFLRWKGAVSSNQLYSKIKFDSFPYRDDKNLTALKRKRNLDLPYRDAAFPKSPLSAVLASRSYSYLVMIRKIGAPNEKILDVVTDLKALNLPKIASLESDGLEISIFDTLSRS